MLQKFVVLRVNLSTCKCAHIPMRTYPCIFILYMFFRTLESDQINSLRASSNGILDILTLLSEVVQKFDAKSPSTHYDHF